MIKRSFIIGLVALAAAGIIFWKWIGVKPTPMNDLDQAAATLQALAPDYNVAKVQAIVEVDSRHLFVPFISEDGEHGMSFWIWDRFKWDLRRIESDGDPHLWKVRGDDSSGQYLVWNVNPSYKVREYAYYWIRKRNAGYSYDDEFYIPQVQLEHRITIGEQTYGTTPLPELWLELQEAQQSAASGARHAGLWGWGSQAPSNYRIGYLPILSGEPEDRGSNGSRGTTFGDNDLSFLYHLNESELEGLSGTKGDSS